MIEKLKYINAISFIEEINTDGHRPLLIIADDFKAYYIKNTRGQEPSISIINEFFCHYLLKIWNIKTPDIAAVKLDTNILPDTLSSFHKSYFYENICFGSKKMNNVTEMSRLLKFDSKINFNKFQKLKDFIKLALFDIWTENDDRKPSNPNLLFELNKNGINIVAIDNAFTFATMNYNNLFKKGVSQSYTDNLLYSDLGKEILHFVRKQNYLIDEIKNYFYLCIKKSKQHFDKIVENIPNTLGFSKELQKSLFEFLFNEKRNKQVLFNFYSYLI